MGTKTICIFTSNFYPYTGGLERYVHLFSLHLAKLGFDITIITSNTLKCQSEEKFEGMKIIRLPVFSLLSGRMPLPKPNAEFFRLARQISSIHADCYIANMRFYYTSLYAGYLGKLNHKPVILIDHITGHQSLDNPILDKISELYDHLMTFILKRCVTEFYGVSSAVGKWLKHFGILNAGVVYNGVETDSDRHSDRDFILEYNLPGNPIIITFAGRLIKEKGAGILADAFIRASEQISGLFLFIAGVGPIENELKSRYSSSGNIIFTGALKHDDMYALLRQTDIVCVPSFFSEGMPTLILEGGLHKCAVISTSMGGATEAIIDNEHGIVIPPKDLNALKNAIITLAENQAYRTRISENLHNRIVNHFDWKNIIDIFAERLNRLIK